MRASVLCLSGDAFWVMPKVRKTGQRFDMLLREMLRLWCPTEDGDRVAVHFVARQELTPYFDEEYEQFRCRTNGYVYTLSDAERLELVSWHWHPDVFSAPHVHVRPGPGGHIPTGRVTFESVIRYLIADIGVEAARDDWREELTRREERHRDFRSWS